MEAMGEDAPEEFAEQNEVLSEKEERLQQREEELEKRERAQRREQAAQFVEEHIGVVTPGHKETVVEALVTLGAQEGATVQFGEGEDAKQKDVAQALRGFIEALPDQIEFSEVTAEDEQETEERPADNSTYARKLTERALEFQEEKAESGVNVTIDEAVAAVREDFEEPSLD
jgi:hypothetical protein